MLISNVKTSSTFSDSVSPVGFYDFGGRLSDRPPGVGPPDGTFSGRRRVLLFLHFFVCLYFYFKYMSQYTPYISITLSLSLSLSVCLSLSLSLSCLHTRTQTHSHTGHL